MTDINTNRSQAISNDIQSQADAIDFKSVIKKLARDTIIYMPAKVVPGFIGVLSIALFTRLFNPDEYGKYVLVVTTTTIIIAVMSQWIFQSILRYRSQYTINFQSVIFNRNLYYILFFLTVFCIIFAGGFLFFKKYLASYERFYYISIIIIISGLWSNILLAIFQADLRSAHFTVYTIIGAILKVMIPVLFIVLLSKDIMFLLYGVLASFIVTIGPMVISINRYNKKNTGEISSNAPNLNQFLSFLKQFYAYGFPMIGWFLGAELLSISDRYFLQFFRGSYEVGIYSSNYNLVASAIAFVTMPLLTAAHPLLMKSGNIITGEKTHIQKLISAFSRYYLLMTIPILTYISFLYKELTEIMLGIDFRQGGIILPIVLFGMLVWNFAMFGHKGLELRNKTHIMFIYVMICAVIKIVLNFIFIPAYGYIAAAVTTLVAFLSYPVLVYIGTKSDIKWNIPWVSALRISIAAILPLGLFFIVRDWQISVFLKIIIDAAIMVLVYFLLLYFFKEITPQEKKYLQSFFHRIATSSKK